MHIKCRKNWRLIHKKDEPSKKKFELVDGHPAAGSNVAKLYHNVCELVHTVAMISALGENFLLSGGKCSDAGYVSICDRSEVNLYDRQSVKITVDEEAVPKVWRFANTKLWRIPLQTDITNLTNQTLLLHWPMGFESKNRRYVLPNSAGLLDQMNLFTQEPAHPPQTDTLNNVYELTSIGREVRYLHVAAVFPTKATWIKDIRKGN